LKAAPPIAVGKHSKEEDEEEGGKSKVILVLN
jgi:hypothetical protein